MNSQSAPETVSMHLFEAFGVELEYMIVDAETLQVRPLADRVLHAACGEYRAEVERDELSWSNELALHVIELKTGGPAPSLVPLADKFQGDVVEVNRLLQPYGAKLLPTAMHPWMDPHRELKLWPHEYNPVYEAYHRIFDCRGHGWANLQSVHLNLPFDGDDEFARLHAAIRLLIPLLPALAASSPVVDGKPTGLLDNRLEVYRTNSVRVPSVTGQVIPEPLFSKASYINMLEAMYRDIAPLDPAGILQQEWLNSRGAIARFDRNTIEIRVLDVQECPQADVALCHLIACVLQAFVNERFCSLAEQQALSTESLFALLRETIRDGEQTIIPDTGYLQVLGLPARPRSAAEIWQHLAAACGALEEPAFSENLNILLHRGPLARRILQTLGNDPSAQRLRAVYAELAKCLAEGRMLKRV